MMATEALYLHGKNIMNKVVFKRIDHMAIAVTNLERAIEFYQGTLGMELLERRETRGKNTGMLSAVMDAGVFSIVLIQGTEKESQVSRYIDEYGQGVQHIAFEVSNLEQAHSHLLKKGVEFATDPILGSGLKQVFSKRDEQSGMMYELIERVSGEGFKQENINQLFEKLEKDEIY